MFIETSSPILSSLVGRGDGECKVIHRTGAVDPFPVSDCFTDEEHFYVEKC